MKRRGMILCLVGPAGGGKTSHGEKLLAQSNGTIRYSVSATTRAPREHEQNGVHYHFLTRKDFEERIKVGAFFEWEEVHGNLYGTLRATVDESIASGIDLLLDIDIRGALNFKRTFHRETVIVFLVPPSVEELRNRVTARSAISSEELARRLATAKLEFDTLLTSLSGPDQIDYFLVNDIRETTFASLLAIVEAERARLIRLDPTELKKICRIE